VAAAWNGIAHVIPTTKMSRNQPVSRMGMLRSKSKWMSSSLHARCTKLAEIAVLVAACRMGCLPQPRRLTPQCRACS
jgi:hypothetical protein